MDKMNILFTDVVKVLEDGDLQTLGMLDYDKRLQHSFTAHPKVDPVTREMFTFGYSHTPPYATYKVISKDGVMQDLVPIIISTPIMMHDFAITENYAIMMDLPLYFRPKAFRSAIKEAAIAQHFELRIVKSDLIHYIAKCASKGCPWRICAFKLPNVSTFTIRSLEGTHTCGKNAQNGHHQACVDWIVNFIKEHLRDNINYKPKNILHDIYKQYGITIPYKQAWRAKERWLRAIYGSSEEGYYLLFAYCEQIKKTNSGSHAEIFTTGSDSRFQRFFIFFYASLHGILNGCLNVICLGSKQLKSKYLGTLLSVTFFDIDGGVFPLAFGAVDEENNDSWMWFLLELRKALDISTEKIPTLTVLSDGQKSIVEAVKKKFPSSCHVIKRIHYKLTEEFEQRRSSSSTWSSTLAPSAEKRIMDGRTHASTYQVLRSNKVEFEVISAEHSDIVNTEKYFTADNYCKSYSKEVHPIPDKLEWSRTRIV
ncbi:putative serine/threonine protein phosphatase 2A 57 kDa regulatory subunit B' iota isoform-like [Capsicum annuum]|nr:putative serine/threonine protein phosphatase 2A 57 kDa regulatory subunit B' iota isoform-like [Capsicum annuum]